MACRVYFILFMMSLGLVYSCGSDQKEEKTIEMKGPNDMVQISQEQLSLNKISWGPCQQLPFPSVAEAYGELTIDPRQQASVGSHFPGFVDAILIQEGEAVDEGQPVFLISSHAFIEHQKDYIQAYAHWELSHENVERQRLLYEKKVSSEKVLLQAENAYKESLAELNAIALMLEHAGVDLHALREGNFLKFLHLNSPIKGKITEMYSTLGQRVEQNEVLAEIVDDHILIAKLNVHEKDILKLHKGDSVALQMLENPDKLFSGTLDRKENILNELNRTTEVYVDLNQQVEALPGMRIKGRISYEAQTGWGIPSPGFVRTAEEEGSIFLYEGRDTANNYLFRHLTVKLISQQQGLCQIHAEHTDLAGKQWVTQGAYHLFASMVLNE